MIFNLRRAAQYLNLLWPFCCCATTPQLAELFSYADEELQNKLVFVMKGLDTASISELRLHFLKSEDCYSGYLGTYRSRSTETISNFPLRSNQPFYLSEKKLYQVVASVLSNDDFFNLHAILIRFVDNNAGLRYQQFAHFTGSCQDQVINCCIPIVCDRLANTCTANYDLGIQNLTWLK